MKKTLCVLISVLLCLMLAVPAFAAAPVLYRDGITNNPRFLLGSNLLRVEGKDGYGLSDIDGNMITGTLYNNFGYTGDYYTAAQVTLEGINIFGMFDSTGKVVVPFEYNIIEAKGDWGVAIALVEATADAYDYTNYDKDAFFNIQRVGLYDLAEARLVVELTRDQFVDYNVVNNCINIMDRANTVTTYDKTGTALGTVDDLYEDELSTPEYTTFRENGQYGIKDAAGNVLLAPSYQIIYDYNHGYWRVYNGEHEGLLDSSLNEVVGLNYDNVKTMMYLAEGEDGSSTGYCALGCVYAVVDDDKVGFVGNGGVELLAPKYGKNLVTVAGVTMYLKDLENNTIIVAADGIETTVSGYGNIYPLDYCSGMYYKVYDEDAGMYGVIDWHGNIVFPCEYTGGITTSGDGNYIVLTKDYTNYEIYKLDYSEAIAALTGGQAPAETPAEETPAETPSETPAEETPVEAPAEETATETPAESTGAADNSAVLGLLNSAITLLNTNAADNAPAVAALLKSAAGQIANPDAAGLITSAAMLLNTDAAANGPAVISLLQSAITLIGG